MMIDVWEVLKERRRRDAVLLAAKTAVNRLHVPVLIKTRFPPGDVVCQTAAVRELHRAYPDRFLTAVACEQAPDLWRGHPNVVERSAFAGQAPIAFDWKIELFKASAASPQSHLSQLWADALADALTVPRYDVLDPAGVILIGDAEVNKRAFPLPYWVVCAGGKADGETKLWPGEHWQAVIDACPDTAFLQVGATHEGHIHNHLTGRNVVNMVGQTDMMDLCRLVRHARGVLCGVSFPMHLAAAFGVPAVVVAGGRENHALYKYRGQVSYNAVGTLNCCLMGGCGRHFVNEVTYSGLPVQTGELCEHAVDGFARCMMDLKPNGVASDVRRIDAH